MKYIFYLSRGGYIGGSQRQLYYVLTNLDHNYKPIVACRENGRFVKCLRESGIDTQVFPLHPWRKLPGALCRYFDAEHIVNFVRQHHVALVHSSDLWLSGYMLWVARRLKIPSVLHVRTPISSKEVRKHRCDKAIMLIAISQRIKQNLISAGIAQDKIVQIDDAVDLELFRPRGIEENVLRQDFSLDRHILIGSVGRIEPSKHQLEFLQAADRVVHDLDDNVTFFIIGEVHSKNYFERLKRFVKDRGLYKNVIFTGRRDDIPAVLGSLDILVSFAGGSVMFEAMACGTTIVSAGFTSRESSFHIQDGKTGVILDTGHPEQLVGVLVRLIKSPKLRKQICIEATRWAEKRFSHKLMAEKIVSLYNQLI
jgi:glycosyltransferase involved in cell wall biosynthesis